MRARDPLDRLAIAGRPLLAEADALVGDGEQEQILERIVTTGRTALRRRPSVALAFVAFGLIVAAAVAGVAFDLHGTATPTSSGHRHIALTGASIQLAGYTFKTPAGFVDSSSPCQPGATDSFSAAASADGGCVSAYFEFGPGTSMIPPGAQPVDVAGGQGFLVTGAEALTLYAPLPKLGDDNQFLVLVGKGLTADELVAIAASGLPGAS